MYVLRMVTDRPLFLARLIDNVADVFCNMIAAIRIMLELSLEFIWHRPKRLRHMAISRSDSPLPHIYPGYQDT